MNHLPENRETGAILPIFALLIVVLIVFTAFTVDLGAAWAERREAQTAADAGAMAGALASGDVVGDAMDFVERNIISATPLDWDACPVPDPAFSSFTDDAGDLVAFNLVDPGVTNCVWIGSANTTTKETYIAVRVPNQAVETAFARIIGIDTIDVNAYAISRLATAGEAKILPFALPVGSPSHSCLGSPPAGLSRNPCTGATSGNFGFLDSPHHGSADLGTTLSCGSGNTKSNLEDNIAMGADHPIVIDTTWTVANASVADDDYPDECVSGDVPPYTPNSIVFVQGAAPKAELHAGLVSNRTDFGSGFPSRLQHPQPSVLTPVLPSHRTVFDGNEGLPLDNIGLWEYIASGDGLCDPTTEPRKTLWGNNPSPPSDAVIGGPLATEELMTCLIAVDDPLDTLTTVTFDAVSLIDSPRFAIVPELYTTFPSGNSTPRAIMQFRAVYLQATWYNCSASSCMKFLDINDDEQDFFFPGEGTEPGCDGTKKCKKSQIDGLSALLLPVEASPSGVIDFGPDSNQASFAELVG